ncbi:MAG TPA: hybrid sensor histidine kinase/response regulator [bacterium]|nr:hybrid sensor histidine kinase/response regulator [bacterium]
MNLPLRVLLVEDREDDAILIEAELRRGGFAPDCRRIESAGEMNRALADGTWDVIISDYSLPRFSGVQALDYLHRTGLDIPFIIVSGTITEETAVAAMRAGAHDYVMKGNLARLVPAILRELREATRRRSLLEAEERLKQAERLKTIGELMASLIHDLNNPLQTILGLAELLKNGQLSPEKRSKHISVIEREVDLIVGMRNDILEFTRGEIKVVRRIVDLSALANEVIETYAPACARQGITLAGSANADPGCDFSIEGDNVRIWRALQNLIANARDAMPAGGRIAVDVHGAVEGVTLEVSDNGGGIPPEIRDTLFMPFVTYGKSQGTGLGLAIVRQIVESHGGTVTFVTEECVGTTFRLFFPRPLNRTSTSHARMPRSQA